MAFWVWRLNIILFFVLRFMKLSTGNDAGGARGKKWPGRKSRSHDCKSRRCRTITGQVTGHVPRRQRGLEDVRPRRETSQKKLAVHDSLPFLRVFLWVRPSSSVTSVSRLFLAPFLSIFLFFFFLCPIVKHGLLLLDIASYLNVQNLWRFRVSFSDWFDADRSIRREPVVLSCVCTTLRISLYSLVLDLYLKGRLTWERMSPFID